MADEQTSQRDAQPIVVSAQEYKHQQAVKAMAEAQEKHLDTTVPGGRYKRGDSFVDANGKELSGDKRAGK